MCPLARGRCPLAVLKLATGLPLPMAIHDSYLHGWILVITVTALVGFSASAVQALAYQKWWLYGVTEQKGIWRAVLYNGFRFVSEYRDWPCLPVFAHPKNLFFHFFFEFSRFQPKFKKTNKMPLLGSTNPIFCAQFLPNWWKKSTLKRAWQTDKKKQLHFLLVWWRHQTEWNQTSPVCSPMWTFFFCRNDFLNRFIRSRDIVEKLLSSPTVQLYKRHFQCLNNNYLINKY